MIQFILSFLLVWSATCLAASAVPPEGVSCEEVKALSSKYRRDFGVSFLKNDNWTCPDTQAAKLMGVLHVYKKLSELSSELSSVTSKTKPLYDFLAQAVGSIVKGGPSCQAGVISYVPGRYGGGYYPEVHICPLWFQTIQDPWYEDPYSFSSLAHEVGHIVSGAGHVVCSKGYHKGYSICDSRLSGFKKGGVNAEFYFLIGVLRGFQLHSTAMTQIRSHAKYLLDNKFNSGQKPLDEFLVDSTSLKERILRFEDRPLPNTFGEFLERLKKLSQFDLEGHAQLERYALEAFPRLERDELKRAFLNLSGGAQIFFLRQILRIRGSFDYWREVLVLEFPLLPMQSADHHIDRKWLQSYILWEVLRDSESS